MRKKIFSEMNFDVPVTFNQNDLGPTGGIQVSTHESLIAEMDCDFFNCVTCNRHTIDANCRFVLFVACSSCIMPMVFCEAYSTMCTSPQMDFIDVSTS
jgi:hypothetical protein